MANPNPYGTPVFWYVPPRNVNFQMLGAQANANVTVPFFQNMVTSPFDKKTYVFQIVGTDPTKSLVTTTVQYVPVALRVHFSDGAVLDPTKPGCGDTKPVETRFFSSPLFTAVPLVSNGVSIGTDQVVGGFQRAEFWKFTHGSAYGLNLTPAAAIRVVDVNAPAGSKTVVGVCAGKAHHLGEIPILGWDNLVVAQVNNFAHTNQLPVIMAYNIVETSGGCCVIGYHSAYGRAAGTQTYATGAYTDPGIFSPGVQDIHAWTHEAGEWANDPFLQNLTPAYGHIGQVAGCQNTLEVGDPLTGTAFVVTLGGFTYHPQEMAFFDWFFRTPSKGTGAKYSFEGTFTSGQGKCV